MQVAPDIDLALKLESAPQGTIYLSVTWQPDKGKDFGYQIVRQLDEARFLVIGDTKGFGEMDPKRIQRIMSQADAFLSVLPYRPDKPCKTSVFMLEELDMAIKLEMPVAIVHDARIALKVTDDPSQTTVALEFPDGRIVTMNRGLLKHHAGFDFGVERSEKRTLVDLSDFLSQATAPASKVIPYSFLVSRLQPDFQLPREACVAAAEYAAGMPCLWIDQLGHKTNVDDTVERARLLIKNAEFVVAEMSLTDENSELDNPSRAHEVGLATAYLKKIFTVSHVPRRHPYHGLVSRQLVWWENESELFESLKTAIHAERGSVGRHVYNWDLEHLGDGYKPNFSAPRFDSSQAAPWRPPASPNAQQAQSWIYAISFGMLAFCLALLLRYRVGYEDTLDLAAIFAGIATFLFSSRINRAIQSALYRVHYLRWLIPLLAGLFLIATIVLLRPNEGESQTPSTTMSEEQVSEEEASEPVSVC